MKHLLFSFCIFTFTAFAPIPSHSGTGGIEFPKDLPPGVQQAISDILESARKQIINGSLLGFVYFDLGLCPDCTTANAEIQKQKLLQSMKDAGADLDHLFSEPVLALHRQEIQTLYAKSPQKDLLSLRLFRTAQDSFTRSIFLNCLDYAKAVAMRARQYGFPDKDMRFFWTMDKAAYLKMCPTPSCKNPVLPRPFVHTMLAFRSNGVWYAINVEMNLKNPNPEIFVLGKSLPKRLGYELMVHFPKIAAEKPLVFAGAFNFKKLSNELPAQLLLDVTQHGRVRASMKQLSCQMLFQ